MDKNKKKEEIAKMIENERNDESKDNENSHKR